MVAGEKRETKTEECAAVSAGAQQACDHVAGRPAVLSLGVGDGTVLLPEMKPQLTLVSEVQVTFFTMIRLLSGMNTHVTLERLKVAEVCSTNLTRVRLLSCVY